MYVLYLNVPVLCRYFSRFAVVAVINDVHPYVLVRLYHNHPQAKAKPSLPTHSSLVYPLSTPPTLSLAPTLSMDESNTKRTRMSTPVASDFILVGKDIQNKAGRPIGSMGTEDRNFREIFGAGPFVVAKLWTLMTDQDLIPPDGKIEHLMWTLHFLKAYPRQGAVCYTVGGSSGAIDPKTFRKYMWPFIHAMANLESVLVIMC